MKLQEIPASFIVFAGGGLGASLRWFLDEVFSGAPLVATFCINVVGALVLGFLLTLLPLLGDDRAGRRVLRLGLGTGVLGGFTTYSTFSVQSVQLLQEDKVGTFFLYTAGSLIAGMMLCWLGMLLAERIAPRLQRQPVAGTE